MHGRLFEIREERIPQDEWVNEFSFCDEDTSSWCDWMCDSADREDDLKWLKKVLPTSIFKVDGDEIEIISDGREFVEKWIEDVRELVNRLDYESFTGYASTWAIERTLQNMIGSDFMFRTSYADYAHGSTEFIKYCINSGKGTKLYVCGIIDYHY